MKKIGLFYGPAGGSTEKVARIIAKKLGSDKVGLHLVINCKKEDVEKYENVILGISTIGKETWNADSAAKDWDLFLPEFEAVNFSGKVIAMFGLGDHIQYPLHFVDALGMLGNILLQKKAKIIGQVDTAGYEYEDSKAIFDGKFIGLPIDEDFEDNLTHKRVEHWLDNILNEFK